MISEYFINSIRRCRSVGGTHSMISEYFISSNTHQISEAELMNILIRYIYMYCTTVPTTMLAQAFSLKRSSLQ
jgi:hypothetical protein